MKFAQVARLLRSGQTAMILLLMTALIAAVGTLYTPEQARHFFAATVGDTGLVVAQRIGLVDLFHGLFFALMLGLVAASVALCTWHRLPLIQVFSAEYSTRSRRRWIVLTDAGTHLSILVVLAAAAADALFGFVGTKNIAVGVPEAMVFNWAANRDIPLGFDVVVQELRQSYFPALAKIGVTEVSTAKQLDLLTVREGAGAVQMGSSHVIENVRYDPASSTLEIVVINDGKPQAVRFSTAPQGQATAIVDRYRLSLVAWRRDLREVVARISIYERGLAVREDILRVNDRLRHRGWNFYLTGWGRSDGGQDFAGIQVTRDPGALYFWIGSVLMSVCLPAFFMLKRRFSDSTRSGRD